ncbi:MAG: hypothetical protein U1F41_11295 [Burkholderiales bacterium]
MLPAHGRGEVVAVSPDFHEVRIELPLNWKTRGYSRSVRRQHAPASIRST